MSYCSEISPYIAQLLSAILFRQVVQRMSDYAKFNIPQGRFVYANRQAADQSMYRAKQSGRGSYVSAGLNG